MCNYSPSPSDNRMTNNDCRLNNCFCFILWLKFSPPTHCITQLVHILEKKTFYMLQENINWTNDAAPRFFESENLLFGFVTNRKSIILFHMHCQNIRIEILESCNADTVVSNRIKNLFSSPPQSHFRVAIYYKFKNDTSSHLLRHRQQRTEITVKVRIAFSFWH